MRSVRWQWWVVVGSALLLLAVPLTRDMLKMQAAGANPKADYYLWYPLWLDDKDLLKAKSFYRFTLPVPSGGGGDTSPMAGAARRLQRRVESDPGDFAASWGAACFLPAGQLHSSAGRKAYAEAARRLAARFPDRQEALLFRASAEIDALPQWPEWYRPDLEQLLGDPGETRGGPVTEAQAAMALEALAKGEKRFPDNAFWQVGMAGVYLQMGRDSDALDAVRAAARKPYFDLAVDEERKLSVEAARESGIPYPEAATTARTWGSPHFRVMRTSQILQALAEGAGEQGRGKKAADYCIAGSELADLIRRTSRSLTALVVGITFASRSAGEVAVALPTEEAGDRELLPGGESMPAREGQRWYKGPLYEAVREEAGQPMLNTLLNHLYAAHSMADALRSYRERSTKAETEAYSRSVSLSWYLMVAGSGLLALAGSLLALAALVRIWWGIQRRPKGNLSTGWQGAILGFTFAIAAAIAAILAARAGAVALAPVLSRVVWIFPIALVFVLGIAARVQTRKVLSPERGIDRARVGMLHQLLPNAMLVVALAYLALAVPTAVMRYQITSAALPYLTGDKRGHFREELEWDEDETRVPFPVGPAVRR